MQVVETRTCEGFARLEEPPAEGMGPLQGSFEMRNGSLSFVAAAKSEARRERRRTLARRRRRVAQ
jgi:hypothetical protein